MSQHSADAHTSAMDSRTRTLLRLWARAIWKPIFAIDRAQLNEWIECVGFAVSITLQLQTLRPTSLTAIAHKWLLAWRRLISHSSSVKFKVKRNLRRSDTFALIEDIRSRVNLSNTTQPNLALSDFGSVSIMLQRIHFCYNSHCGRSRLICISISNYGTFEALTLAWCCTPHCPQMTIRTEHIFRSA